VLDLFGVEAPRYMQGRSLFEGETDVAGPVDPRQIVQHGAAPGALVFPPEEAGAPAPDAGDVEPVAPDRTGPRP